MSKWVKCDKCGHVGDLHESVYFTGRSDHFKFALACSQCASPNVTLVSKELEDEQK